MPDIAVLDSAIHFEDTGTGSAVIFLHGSPGSSYLWRKVIPGVGSGRLLAPDLIGMGQSGKPDVPYLFADHARYLEAWFDTLGLADVVLVGHDWGGALAFDWSARHPGRVRGIAFLESIVKPMDWEELSPEARQRQEALRAPGTGEEAGLQQDLIVRGAFTRAVLNPVSDEDLETYLAPYKTPESRRPLLAWARQVPLGGEPRELIERIEAYDEWLKASAGVPKLLMTFEGSPTLLIGRQQAEWCAANIAALEIVACGQAGHHAPEDRPLEIAAAVRAWIDRHELR